MSGIHGRLHGSGYFGEPGIGVVFLGSLLSGRSILFHGVQGYFDRQRHGSFFQRLV